MRVDDQMGQKSGCPNKNPDPSNPIFLNRFMSSRLDTGVSLFDNAYRLR